MVALAGQQKYILITWLSSFAKVFSFRGLKRHLKQLEIYNMRLNLAKYIFGIREEKFLGYLITKEVSR